MAIIVQKYGGSSVADVGKLKYVAERVMQTARRGHQVVVVVSAMGDTTDELLAMARRQLWIRPGSAKDDRLEALVRHRAVELGDGWTLDRSPTRIGVASWPSPR